jgi:hypothetical protein
MHFVKVVGDNLLYASVRNVSRSSARMPGRVRQGAPRWRGVSTAPHAACHSLMATRGVSYPPPMHGQILMGGPLCLRSAWLAGGVLFLSVVNFSFSPPPTGHRGAGKQCPAGGYHAAAETRRTARLAGVSWFRAARGTVMASRDARSERLRRGRWGAKRHRRMRRARAPPPCARGNGTEGWDGGQNQFFNRGLLRGSPPYQLAHNLPPKEQGGSWNSGSWSFCEGLRLRWLWLRWKSKDRAWAAMKLPCDRTDEDLFNASTMVTVGNGKIAKLWKSSWIQGQAPKSIAPSLFRKTKRKNITVDKALTNNNWVRLCFPCSGEVGA